MSTLIILYPDGMRDVNEYARQKMPLDEMYQIIGCKCVTRTEIKWEGKKQYVWLDDEGVLRGKPINRQIRPLAEAFWGRTCQEFCGVGLIFIPTPRKRA